MPALTAEDKLEYLISALQHASDLPIDFHKVAEDHNIVNANKAQIKFKKIIDDTGKFKLTAGKVIALDKKDVATTSVKKTRGRPKKNATTKNEVGQPPQKKRKVQEIEVEDKAESDEGNDDDEED